jgi:hypothetical protein
MRSSQVSEKVALIKRYYCYSHCNDDFNWKSYPTQKLAKFENMNRFKKSDYQRKLHPKTYQHQKVLCSTAKDKLSSDMKQDSKRDCIQFLCCSVCQSMSVFTITAHRTLCTLSIHFSPTTCFGCSGYDQVESQQHTRENKLLQLMD